MKTFLSAKLMAFCRSLLLVVLTVGSQAAVAVPTILSFTASDSSVTPGTEVSLSWEVQDFDQLLLGDVDVTGLTSVPVAPLVTTSYTLTARNQDGDATARVRVEVVDAPGLIGAAGRYVEVVKNDPNNTQLHLSEIEVFEFGATPDESLLSGLSSNNLVRSGTPSVQAPPTTTELDHGIPERVFNGGLERGTGIWTTRNGLGEKPRYMLDLGAAQSIGTVRLFGRADTCCLDRLENVTVNVYADGGDDTPGDLISSATFPGTAPTGNAGHIELDLSILDPGIREFATGQFLIAPGDPVTLAWEVNSTTTRVMIDQGVGDVTARTGPAGLGGITLDPGPLANTVYTLTATRPGGTSIASLLVRVTNQPRIFSFDADASPVSPGAEVRLSWLVGNVTSVSLNGQDVTAVDGITVTPESTTAYTLTASNPNGSTREELRVQVVLPGEPILSEFMANNETGLEDEDGEPSDWIELCNPTGVAASLDGYYLTDDPRDLTKWRFPDVAVAPRDYLVVFASGNDRAKVGSELHTNFSLEREGEYLALVRPDGITIVNEFAPYPEQRQDVSYGFGNDALGEGFFVPASPGSRNRNSFSDFVADTRFSVDRGFYAQPVEVAITSATPDAEIRYTTDGSRPTATTGRVYTSPLTIRRTTVLRAAAFKRGFVPTNVDTQTYIFTADVIADPGMSTSITENPAYAHLMDASLRSIPSISLVFDGDIVRSEKEASIEFINFEAGHAQVEAGMERFGNYVTDFAKRGVRLNFRAEYGANKLRFPVFDGHQYNIPPADEFDSINLRSGNHDTQWGAYTSNRFTDDSMIEMGNIAPHGRFVHVYLNGRYNGQYHLRERWNGAMVSEYYAGGKDDYEAVNANDGFAQNMRVYDGSGRHWNRAQTLVAGPEPFTRAARHIDMANIIDFMLLWVCGACESEFRSAGAVPAGVPFKFFIKDADGYLRSPVHDVYHPGPLSIMSRLRTENDPDYKVLLADRIHKHFFNDGALTPGKNIARLQRRVDESRLSFLAESARWRNHTPTSWENFQDNLIRNHFPNLTATMIGRFRRAGMYPALDAPSFSQHGGSVPTGFTLRISGPVRVSRIYYTLDGSDPRISANPVQVGLPITLVEESAPKTVHVPATATDRFVDDAGKAWTEPGYDDSGWISGRGGVGFEMDAGYRHLIQTDVVAEMHDRRRSCLIRIPFTPDPEALDGANRAELRIRYDDGFVAYLNGTEIARRNFSGEPDGDSGASSSQNDTAAVSLETIDISAHRGLLEETEKNVLAIHGVNLSTGSPDFLISADLRVVKSPTGGEPGGVSPTALLYEDSIPIVERTTVRARALRGEEWSALNEAIFTPQQDFRPLVVSEIMYNPTPATAGEIATGHDDSEDFEYLELFNAGDRPLDLAGVRFVDGIEFDFTGSELAFLPPGGRVLVVKDAEAFAFRYGAGLPVAGQYGGQLRNEGESLEIVDALDNSIRFFSYDDQDPWPAVANGLGSSLVLVDPDSQPDHNRPASWRASGLPGGTPGGAELRPQSYDTWAVANGIVDPEGDDDSDGLGNYLEYVLLEDPHLPSTGGQVAPAIVNLDLGGGPADFLSLEVKHRLTSTEFEVIVEISGDLVTWDRSGRSIAFHNRVYHGDGSVSSTFRSTVPVSAGLAGFLRVRFESR